MHRLLAPVGVVAAALAVLGAAAPTPALSLAPCTGAQLSGTFSVVRGSAGAGNISYALSVENRSQRTCVLSGLARLRLLGKRGRALATDVAPAFRGALTAVRIVLRPGGRAKATARFSPDVPGVGEPAAGRQCEPTAYSLRVTPPGGGSLVARIAPPTPVCEHGRLLLTAFSAP